MPEARRLTLPELREIVSDPSELAKGTKIMDDKGLAHLARHEHKLFADAAGSGSSPYKVQIVFDDKGIRGRCSCMAARSRPFCKHAAALLVAWARAPESFAEAAGAPPGAEPADAKKKQVKQGKVDSKDLMARGVEQAATLLRELAVSGVASVAADRADQVRGLGESLREARLRRVSARTLDLADHLLKAARRSEAFDASEYAELVGDMLLTVRKLEKHLGGEPLEDHHVEELVGKTWTKKDRKPAGELDLVEYAFVSRTTPDDFVIRESRFVDVATGEHYSEKQILPGFLAKRTEPKKSWAGRLLGRTAGSLYPGYTPRRLDIESVALEERVGAAALERLLDKALPGVAAALAALQERRKDVFAPDAAPVALRVDTVLAEGARMRVVDAGNAALFLPDEASSEEALARVLRGARLEAILGDVALDGALPTVFPLAAVVRADGELALVALGGLDAAAQLETKKVRARARQQETAPVVRWADVARRAGASEAAIALGEVREEMAQALATGLPSVVARFADPLVSRLRDLGLAKQAELLSALAARADAAEKLDDFVKLHQVLGIALARLAGATHVDRSELVPVPTFESVHIRRPDRTLEPREVASAQAAGEINRYQAAAHYARYYEALPPSALVESIYPTWADGSAAPYIARALSRSPDAALEAARRVLAPDGADTADAAAAPGVAYFARRARGRVAKLTAIRVLAALRTPEAKKLLWQCMTLRDVDPALVAHARRALSGSDAELPAAERERMEASVNMVLNGSQKDDRMRALRALGDGGYVEAIPAMRASFLGDVSGEVREAAAFALARVGDVESVDVFVRMLKRRAVNPMEGKIGAQALGVLGDVRGIDELLRAYAEGWQPGIVAEAIRQIGAAALEPLVALVEAHPEILERKAALSVAAALPEEDVATLLISRLDAMCGSPDFCERAAACVRLAGALPNAAKRVVRRVVELRPAMLDKKKSSSEEKALARVCAKFVD